MNLKDFKIGKKIKLKEIKDFTIKILDERCYSDHMDSCPKVLNKNGLHCNCGCDANNIMVEKSIKMLKKL